MMKIVVVLWMYLILIIMQIFLLVWKNKLILLLVCQIIQVVFILDVQLVILKILQANNKLVQTFNNV